MSKQISLQDALRVSLAPKVVTAKAMEAALRKMLRASHAFGRNVSDSEQRMFNSAWDEAQNLLSRTQMGAEHI